MSDLTFIYVVKDIHVCVITFILYANAQTCCLRSGSAHVFCQALLGDVTFGVPCLSLIRKAVVLGVRICRQQFHLTTNVFKERQQKNH